MVLSARIARWNRRGLNKVTGRIAPWMPGFGVVTHVGRRSGRSYTTPVNVFPRPGGGMLLCLTYGAGADWVKNVLAAGGCQVRSRSQDRTFVNPRLITDPGLAAREGLPAFVRFVLSRLHVDEFVVLDPDADPTPAGTPGQQGDEQTTS